MKKNILSLPVPLPFFIGLLLLPVFILALVSVLNVSSGDLALRTMGLSVPVLLVIYMAMLLGGFVNIPVYVFKSPGETEPKHVSYMGMKYKLPVWHGHNTQVSLNLGGCIIAVLLSLYFALSLPPVPLILSSIAVALGVFATSTAIRGTGVIAPALIPPLLAIAISFIVLSLYQGGITGIARMAFATGTFGTILGAYVLNYRRIRRAGPALVSVGGAGTFEAIFLAGVLATIFAAVLQ